MRLHFFFLIQILLSLSYCNVSAQILEVVKGTVTYRFSNDKIEDERYWLVDKEFAGLYFIEDIADIIGIWDLICGGIAIEIPTNKIRMYDLPQYRTQGWEGNIYNTHYGGDIYHNSKGEIILSFQMKAQVIKLEKPPCEGFVLSSTYSCPVIREQIKYPIYIIINVIKAKSLNKRIIKAKDIVPHTQRSFFWGNCE